jgi:uncharacterized repeat protein (TIGR03803 family)
MRSKFVSVFAALWSRSISRRVGQSSRWRQRHKSLPLRVEQLETRLTPSFSLNTLVSFDGTNGADPFATLIMDASGNLYGTTSRGTFGLGTVFELAQGSGTLTTLASFNGNNGSSPQAGLLMDSSGNLYGTTTNGGAYGNGTVFELAKGSGTLTALASFNGTNGSSPQAGLLMDSDGNLYGTTTNGGAYGSSYRGFGTVFELARGTGAINTLASFDGGNGDFPYAELIMDASGNLYGTTFEGGAYARGTVFELAKGSGTITTLASFDGTDGLHPYAGLFMDASGNLYGTTVFGGPGFQDGVTTGYGTVFELAQGSGTITTLASFDGTDGANPYAGLVMDSSGNLYGTTTNGGAGNVGTVFEVVQGSGTITTLASFNGTNGSSPQAGLLMDSSGNLYGTTTGENANDGTVFELVPYTPPTDSISGPTDGVTMQHRDFVLTANDTNGNNNAAGFSFAINWGDGSTETVTAQSPITADHQYASAGSYVISVTATNLADGSTSPPATLTDTITTTEVQGGNLALGGVPGNDAWLITKGTKAGTYTVTVNGSPLISNFIPVVGQQIFLYCGNGSNTYTINDTGTTADTFTLGAGYVTFIKQTFVATQNPGPWTVHGNNGKDSYRITGAANASIVGGSGVNTYNLLTGGSLSGTLYAGSGAGNTLSYAGYATSGVVVNLPLGSATAIDGGASGGISGIRNVTGSQNGGDILVGDQNPNILKANKGHNILIGGSGGGDSLTSGGADILIAGTTSYDTNIAALKAILATWKTSTTSNYFTVMSTIMSNSFADPLNVSTVVDSGAMDVADTLTGKGKPTADWFFAHTSGGGQPNDNIINEGSGDTVTSI